MIDINELRRLAQAATPNVGRACNYQNEHWIREGHVDFDNADLFIASERPQEDAEFYAAVNPAAVIELLDRLEAAESDGLEQARLNGMGSEREAPLIAKLEAAEKERDELRAKVECMEKQEPEFWWRKRSDGAYEGPIHNSSIEDARKQSGAWSPLYALPGAQPATSVPSVEAAELMGAKGGSAVDAERLAFEAWMRGHCWKLGAKWTGTEYRSAFEKDGMVDMHAMRTRELWAAWRDRAALAAAPEAKP